MFIEDRLESIEKSLEEIKNILLHRVVPIQEVETPVKEPKKATKNPKEEPKQTEAPSTLPQGHKTIQGIITQPAKYSEIGESKTPKWLFVMGELKLGTFSKQVFEEISAVLDLQSKMGEDKHILLEIEYKERVSGDKVLKDIISFKQVNTDMVNV